MTKKNKHGLPRDIPAEIRREVRQRCGFGCVRCGHAIIDYEHFDPPFHECAKHLADGITLLCIECHGHKERGWLDVEEIRAANADPFCKREGFSFGPFNIGRKTMPRVRIGVVSMMNVKIPLRINQSDIISIKPSESDNGPFLLSAQFFDSKGDLLISIIDNEWRTRAENWDVQVEGQKKDGNKGGSITIRRGRGDIVLELRVEPPDSISVERLDMFHKGVKVTCRDGQPLKIVGDNGLFMETTRASLEGFECGISFDEEVLGIGVGDGGGRMRLHTMSMGPQIDEQASFPKANPKVASRGNDDSKYQFISKSTFDRLRHLQCSCGSGRVFKDCHGKY